MFYDADDEYARQIHTIVLIRHGESQWNIENRFTGWVDVPLAPTGVAESHRAAAEIKKENLEFDVVYTSVLKRAIKTAWNILEDNDAMHTPVIQDWRLNERMYGSLQGELPGRREIHKHYCCASACLSCQRWHSHTGLSVMRPIVLQICDYSVSFKISVLIDLRDAFRAPDAHASRPCRGPLRILTRTRHLRVCFPCFYLFVLHRHLSLSLDRGPPIPNPSPSLSLCLSIPSPMPPLSIRPFASSIRMGNPRTRTKYTRAGQDRDCREARP